MKKLLFLFVLTSLVSCKALQLGDMYKPISLVNNLVEIGMTKAQFLAIAGDRAEKDAMDETRTVYRINQYNNNGYSGDYVTDSMFYYFYADTDILYKVNAGVKNN